MVDGTESRPGRVPSFRRIAACAMLIGAPLGLAGQAARAQSDEAIGTVGILSEVRVGVLNHDIGVFGEQIEDGIDGNIEFLFVAPEFLDIILSPRPHVGLTVNSEGNTSQLYAGLAWDWTFMAPFFVEGSLALSAHNGRLRETTADEKGMGCRVLFRESVSLGARFLERHSLSLMLTHISNAGLCDPNKGLDTVGIRYGYRF